MSQTVYRYSVYCTNAPAHEEEVWGTLPPTVCPSDGTPIDPNKTYVIEKIQSNDVNVINNANTSYGTLRSEGLKPLLQLSFVYSNNPQLMTETITGSGSVTNSGHMAIISTGAAISSTAELKSLHPIKYRAGQGLLTRFSALFTAGVIGNTQMVGLFNNDDGIGFGYNEVDFGIFHRNNTLETWVLQPDWNLDPLDGSGPSGVTIDFSQGYGNVFQTQIQVFGGLSFYVENPGTGEFIKVHLIAYANTSNIPAFNISSFPLCIRSENTTNNTDIIVKSAGMMAAIEGKVCYIGPQFVDIWNNVSVNNGSETFIAAWQVKSTFNGYVSKIIVYGTKITMATGSTDKPQILRIHKNATFTSPGWTDISTSTSVVQRLTSGTWNNDGTIIIQQVVPGRGDLFEQNISITPTSLYGVPGDNLVITLHGIGGVGESTGSLGWLEDQ